MTDFTSLRANFSADDEGAQDLSEQEFVDLNRVEAERLIAKVKNIQFKSRLQRIYDKAHQQVSAGAVSASDSAPEIFQWLSLRSGSDVLTEDEQFVFWKNFSQFATMLREKKVTIRDARKLVESIKNALKTQTVRIMKSRGYVFGGLLGAGGGGRALLYYVIAHATGMVYCGKVYSIAESETLQAEMNTSELVHRLECPYVVKYLACEEFRHETAPDRAQVVLIMPLFQISLAAMLEAYGGEPLSRAVWLKIAFTLLRAGNRFQDVGMSHSDIKPENVMMKDGDFCVIDLGASVMLGAAVRELTRGYGLDSNTLSVGADFDLCCIAVTLLRCAVTGYVVKVTNTKEKFTEDLNRLNEEEKIDPYAHAFILQILRSGDGCRGALVNAQRFFEA